MADPDKVVAISDPGTVQLLDEYRSLMATIRELKAAAEDVAKKAEKIKAVLIEAAKVDAEAEPPDDKETTLTTVGGKPVYTVTQSGQDRIDPKKVRDYYPDIVKAVTRRTTVTRLTLAEEE